MSSLQIKAWMLPLIVLALVVPGSVGFIVAGPGLGLAIGALAAASIIVIAVRLGSDAPFEVATSADERQRVLLVVTEAVDEPPAVGEVARAIGDGDETAEVLILAPARNRFLDHWATDLERGRREAQRKLVLSVAALATADVEARGAVGDPDLLQATEDALRSFAADQVILVTGDERRDRSGAKVAAELKRRLSVPLDHLTVDGRQLNGQPSGRR